MTLGGVVREDVLRTTVQQRGKFNQKRKPVEKGPQAGRKVTCVKSRKARMTTEWRETTHVEALSHGEELALNLITMGSH